MELLDRYLQAVQFWLPKKLKQDIIAELSEDLRSQIEEKEIQLDRKLTEPELEELLKRVGPPLTVASHYLPKRYLIGPTMFPIYQFVLGIMLLGVIVPRSLVWIGFLILDPKDRGVLNMSNMFETVVFFAFFTTLTFAILERSGIKAQILDHWNPRKLPSARNPNRISRCASLFEIGAILIFNVWFISSFWPSPVIDIYGVQVDMTPVWRPIFFAFAAIAAVNLVLASVNLLRPYWTVLRASVRLLTDAIGGGVFCWLLKAQVLVGIHAASLSQAQGELLTNLKNYWMIKAFPWAVFMILIVAGIDLYRVIRVRKAGPPVAGKLAHA